MEQRAIAQQPQELCSALVFPGVGVKPSGREGNFFARYSSVMSPYLEAAGTQAEADFPGAVADQVVASEWSELQHQLFAYAFNVAVAEVYLHRGLRPSFLAGHSLGLYSALTAGRVIAFHQGLAIVAEAYQLACAACPARDGALAVVVGLTAADVDSLLDQDPRASLCRVNANNELTHVVAGRQGEVASFVAVASEAGALRTHCLPVAVPYHHPEMLASVPAEFRSFLRQFDWASPTAPILSTIDGQLCTNGAELLELTARNIATPINWQCVVDTLIELQVQCFFECGPGVTLSQLGRFHEGTPPWINLKNVKHKVGW
jgi:[acyl-carrier-protein] S-malonyltransferase